MSFSLLKNIIIGSGTPPVSSLSQLESTPGAVFNSKVADEFQRIMSSCRISATECSAQFAREPRSITSILLKEYLGIILQSRSYAKPRSVSSIIREASAMRTESLVKAIDPKLVLNPRTPSIERKSDVGSGTVTKLPPTQDTFEKNPKKHKAMAPQKVAGQPVQTTESFGKVPKQQLSPERGVKSSAAPAPSPILSNLNTKSDEMLHHRRTKTVELGTQHDDVGGLNSLPKESVNRRGKAVTTESDLLARADREIMQKVNDPSEPESIAYTRDLNPKANLDQLPNSVSKESPQVSIIAKVASRILVSVGGLAQGQEVRITFKNHILPETEVRILKNTQGKVELEFVTKSSESAAWLRDNVGELEQTMGSEKIASISVVRLDKAGEAVPVTPISVNKIHQQEKATEVKNEAGQADSGNGGTEDGNQGRSKGIFLFDVTRESSS